MKKPLVGIAVAVVLLAFGIAVGVMTGALTIKPVTAQNVRALLQTMFVVALFIERALEVFVSAWRDPGAAPLEAAAETAQEALKQAIASGVPSAIQAAQQALDAAEAALKVYKAETKRIALSAAIVVGVLVAAAGLRTFETFVELRASHQGSWDEIAGALFNAVNVVITGGLLGGGSDLIHKILKVITDFLQQTSKRIQKAA
jgi:hypothetical protein